MWFFLLIVILIVLYFIIKEAVSNGIDSSREIKKLREDVDHLRVQLKESKGMPKANVTDRLQVNLKPVDKKIFERIHQYLKEQGYEFEQVVGTPFDEIFVVKTYQEFLFLRVNEHTVSLVDQDQLEPEWLKWLEAAK